jgi:hypothetical protein
VAVLAFIKYRQEHPELPPSQAEMEEGAGLLQRQLTTSALTMRVISAIEASSPDDRRMSEWLVDYLGR